MALCRRGIDQGDVDATVAVTPAQATSRRCRCRYGRRPRYRRLRHPVLSRPRRRAGRALGANASASGWAWGQAGDDRAPGPETSLAQLRQRSPSDRRRGPRRAVRRVPSWFMRVTCERCGQERMFNEVHSAQRAMLIRDISTRCGTTVRRQGREGGADHRHRGRQQPAGAPDRAAGKGAFR